VIEFLSFCSRTEKNKKSLESTCHEDFRDIICRIEKAKWRLIYFPFKIQSHLHTDELPRSVKSDEFLVAARYNTWGGPLWVYMMGCHDARETSLELLSLMPL